MPTTFRSKAERQKKLMDRFFATLGVAIPLYGVFVTRPRLGHFQRYIVSRRSMDDEFNALFPPPLPSHAGPESTERLKAKFDNRHFITNTAQELRKNHEILILESQVEAMASGPDGAQGVKLSVADRYFFADATVTFAGAAGDKVSPRQLRFIGVCMIWFKW